MKKYKILALISLILSLIFTLVGCNKDNDKLGEYEYNIYFVNEDYSNLVTETYTIKSKNKDTLVKSMLKVLNTYDSESEYYNAKPKEVTINSYDITDKILNLYFDSSYNNMDNVTELLCRSAIVLTLTQIPDVEYVSFFVDGQPLLDSNDIPVGSMMASDFVDLYGDSLMTPQTIKTVLYFANETGDKLIPYTYEGVYEKNQSIEQFIIERLREDIEGSNVYKTIPDEVELINIATKDGVCYIDFDETFLTASLDISDDVAIYSIVNSLCETDYITKVQISVKGQTDKMYHENISLTKKFVRNLDIVVSESSK